jgi:serine protease inhibitor
MIASGPPSFSVTRPFLFYIIDDATSAILFQGRIVDPR